MIILSFKRGTTREEAREFLADYWVPEAVDFNTDTQLFEVAVRPFDKEKD